MKRKEKFLLASLMLREARLREGQRVAVGDFDQEPLEVEVEEEGRLAQVQQVFVEEDEKLVLEHAVLFLCWSEPTLHSPEDGSAMWSSQPSKWVVLSSLSSLEGAYARLTSLLGVR